MFKVPQSELQEIFQLSEPEAKKYALAMANLNISFSNVKLQLATAMMPLFERMATAFDKFLRGPGGQMAKDFGAWLKKLDIDWDKVAKGVVTILDALTNFFAGMLKFFKEMDPIVQQMGGWKAIIIGLGVVIGVGGLAGFLGGLGPPLIIIGNAAWIVPLIAMVALTDKETGPSEGAGKGKRLDRPGTTPGGGTSAAPGSSPGGSGTAPTIDLPDVTVKPPRTRRQQRSDLDPENAAPYRVASLGWQPPPRSQTDTTELRREVSAFTDQVQAFSEFVTSQIPLSDASGAGGLAGMAGAFSGAAAASAVVAVADLEAVVAAIVAAVVARAAAARGLSAAVRSAPCRMTRARRGILIWPRCANRRSRKSKTIPRSRNCFSSSSNTRTAVAVRHRSRQWRSCSPAPAC